jgi:hypothetical protein
MNRSFDNQRYRASRLNLVVAAIALWNTVYLERAADALARSRAVDFALFQHVSPLGWEHINLTGGIFRAGYGADIQWPWGAAGVDTLSARGVDHAAASGWSWRPLRPGRSVWLDQSHVAAAAPAARPRDVVPLWPVRRRCCKSFFTIPRETR